MLLLPTSYQFASHNTNVPLISLDILIVFLIEKINNEMNNEPSHTGLHVSIKNTVLFAHLLCTSDNTRQAKHMLNMHAVNNSL